MKTLTIILFLLLFFCSCDWPRDKMPSDFNFSFAKDYGEKLNTFDSTYYRLYRNHDTTIKVVLTAEELQNIFQVMEDNEVLDLPDSFEVAKENATDKLPNSSYSLTVQMNGKIKEIKYDDCCEPKTNPDQAERFFKIIDALTNFISTKKEIKYLPKRDVYLM